MLKYFKSIIFNYRARRSWNCSYQRADHGFYSSLRLH